ncbi:MAG: hypothetical protein PVI57_00710 [Gemmatimonadota bacterium]|jgi:hypothetical protein
MPIDLPVEIRCAAVVLPLLLLTAACDARAGRERQALGREYFDSTGSYVHAGVSTRARADIDPLDVSSLDGDTTAADFKLYQMRCAACHELPDPTMKTGEHWSFLIGRMQGKTETAGLIPMTDEEAEAILGFLRRHARR